MSEKAPLRQRIRHRRASLNTRVRRQAARAIAKRARTLRRFQRAHRVAAYIARHGESDPQPLAQAALNLGKRVYLPVLHPFFHGRLKFCQLRANTILQANRFGIPEPIARTECLRDSRRLDLVLVPLVAFDSQGYRLGMGGGYYDRSFAYRHSSSRVRPLLIGLAYEFQLVDDLPHEAWDIRLDAVITERNIYRFNPVVA
ncbi:MAG: 5-formyltetrahydrofolate cyclo-ligase [Boseongicola sp.]|nr:5-formyltetrahydrofolate cyclo-ligase [Boseongicola sp.]